LRTPGEWFAILRKGNEDLNDTLTAVQKVYEQKYFRDIATKVRQQVTSGIAITNAKVFDAGSRTVKSNMTILVENGMIKKVSTDKTIPKGFTTIDAVNKFVMPGLWDMHVHYSDPSNGILHLACGVTNVRDMANSESLIDKKKEIDDGHTSRTAHSGDVWLYRWCRSVCWSHGKDNLYLGRKVSRR
jgi:hypothetical protein